MKIIEKYKAELDLVRQNSQLLDNYSFDKASANSKHFERLRLNIAIYNDLKETDFEIVKFLFSEEKEWRKSGKDGEVDNLYFSAFLLTRFNSPEIIWLFFEVKNIDFDSGIGFDGEYLLSAGIKETYQYLKKVEHPLKHQLLQYIGKTEDHCKYSQTDIDDWKEYRKSYFRSYQFPIEDELDFLYSVNERELFLTKFPEWIQQERNWSYEERALYRTYAKYAGDKALQIEAIKLSITRNDKDFLADIYNIQLAQLYIETGENAKALEVLEKTIKGSRTSNIIRDCVEQLCQLIITTKSEFNETMMQSYDIIIAQQKKYSSFSPKVNDLIKEVIQIMKEEQMNRPHSSCPNEKRPTWWQRFFGSK